MSFLVLQATVDCSVCNQEPTINIPLCFPFSPAAAAVDYLAKNVSLSSQRRMKLTDHSAVLGLLQVETGQAY